MNGSVTLTVVVQTDLDYILHDMMLPYVREKNGGSGDALLPVNLLKCEDELCRRIHIGLWVHPSMSHTAVSPKCQGIKEPGWDKGKATLTSLWGRLFIETASSLLRMFTSQQSISGLRF